MSLAERVRFLERYVREPQVVGAVAPTPVMLDHAYVEYASDDATDLVRVHENLVVVRTLSKAWGLAGCRVGYAVARPETVRHLRAAGAQ